MEGETSQSDTPDVDVTTRVDYDQDVANVLYGHRNDPDGHADEPEAQAPVEENNAQEASEEVSEQPEVPDVVSASQETEQSEEAPKPDQAEASEEAEGEPISSLAHLAEHLDTDEDYLQSLTVTKKVNGEEVETTIGELLKVDQTMDAAQQILADAKEKRGTILEEVNAEREAIAKKSAETAAVLTVMEQLAGLGEGKEARLAQVLKEQGETAYLVEKDRLETAEKKFGQIREYATEAITSVMESLTGDARTEEERQEQLIEENRMLLEKIPAWKDDPELQAREAQELTQYLADEYQYEPEQIKGTTDHKLWVMARKAWLYDKSQATSKATKKIVRSIPMKSGSSTKASTDSKPKTNQEILYGKRT